MAHHITLKCYPRSFGYTVTRYIDLKHVVRLACWSRRPDINDAVYIANAYFWQILTTSYKYWHFARCKSETESDISTSGDSRSLALRLCKGRIHSSDSAVLKLSFKVTFIFASFLFQADHDVENVQSLWLTKKVSKNKAWASLMLSDRW